MINKKYKRKLDRSEKFVIICLLLFVVVLFMLVLFNRCEADPIITVTNYAIDSSITRVFSPLAIPRFQIACFSDSGDLLLLSSDFSILTRWWYLTKNLDSSVRWVDTWDNNTWRAYNHANVSVYNDTVFAGADQTDMYQQSRWTRINDAGINDSIKFIDTVNFPIDIVDKLTFWPIIGTDTIIAISRNSGDVSNQYNLLYFISTNRGASYGDSLRLVDWSSVATRVRMGGLTYHGTVALVADSSDQALVWFEWDRTNKIWNNKGKAINRAIYRAYGQNRINDSIRVVACFNPLANIDTIYWSYRNLNASSWTQGTSIQASTFNLPTAPTLALSYIERSNRLVLFYAKALVNNIDSVDIYMRYLNTTTMEWSSETKISEGRNSDLLGSVFSVPYSHGDVCYVTYDMDSTIGGTVYHYGQIAKITFNEINNVSTKINKSHLRKIDL